MVFFGGGRGKQFPKNGAYTRQQENNFSVWETKTPLTSLTGSVPGSDMFIIIIIIIIMIALRPRTVQAMTRLTDKASTQAWQGRFAKFSSPSKTREGDVAQQDNQ